MNLRALISPYTTLQHMNMVLMIISVQHGIRTLSRWFGHSVGSASAMVGD